MGFLDNLLKRGTQKFISGVVDSVVDSVVDNVKGSKNSNNTGTTVSGGANSAAATARLQGPDEEDCGHDKAVIKARVEKVFAEEWSGYEVRRNIPAAEMGAPEGSWDYTYGLYLDGQPKAMVMVLNFNDDYRRKGVKLSHRACQEKGVFCMNLIPHLPNRRSYISQRLKDNVRI